MKRLAILGSTGSIGTQALDVARSHPELFRVTVLAANTNDSLIERQIEEFCPLAAVLADAEAAERLRSRYRGRTEIRGGEKALLDAAALDEVDVVVTSMVGFAGLAPTLAALKAGKNIALANKETLVVAGELVTALAKEKGVSILPVDSEHCALFQCLQGERRETVERLILTASGGPFRGKTTEDLRSVTVADCLKHPTWSMGRKITVDSATLVNKGLEVIEAHWLYGVPYEKIDVAVHPQSIVHSMVEFRDGAVMAQLGLPDMRLPIQYALTYPSREQANFGRMDFRAGMNLSFEAPDMHTFRGLPLAYEAGKAGGTMPCVLNGANEEAVAAFLAGRIGFLDIYDCIERAMDAQENFAHPSFEALCEADACARAFVRGFLDSKEVQ
ncbi:MAG: 1-deoxy-D-xylulose-5-phosphate reductoisomerase [Schwartzia succinivorans]|nr:1-deoxy-D-xylulose-5-phosphate reductoisomerase [Schwartzia succinivorans]